MVAPMNERERLKAALYLEDQDRPVAGALTLLTEDMYKEAKTISPKGIFDNPKGLATLSKLGHDLYGFDLCEIFNIWGHVEYLGVNVDYGDGTGQPYVKSSPYTVDSDFEVPDIDKYLEFHKTQTALSGVRELRKMVGPEGAVSCICSWGPLTCAGHLLGTEQVMMMMMTEPDIVKKATDMMSRFSAEAYRIELENGMADDLDLMCVAEPTATGDMISPDMFEEFAMPYNRREHETLHKYGLPSMLHICGNTVANLPVMIQCKSNGISVEQSVDPYEIFKVADNKVALFGNVGPITPMWQGSPADVEAAVCKSMDAGFRVIAPGCSFVPMTPAENMRAYTKAVRDHGKPISKV